MIDGTVKFRKINLQDPKVPALQIFVVDSDNFVLNSAICVPENSTQDYKAYFAIYRDNGKVDVNHYKDPREYPVTLGKSPIVSMFSEKVFKTTIGAHEDWKQYIRGLFAIALLDYCFILKSLCNIRVEAPEFTFRGGYQEDVDDIISKSLNYF